MEQVIQILVVVILLFTGNCDAHDAGDNRYTDLSSDEVEGVIIDKLNSNEKKEILEGIHFILDEKIKTEETRSKLLSLLFHADNTSKIIYGDIGSGSVREEACYALEMLYGIKTRHSEKGENRIPILLEKLNDHPDFSNHNVNKLIKSLAQEEKKTLPHRIEKKHSKVENDVKEIQLAQKETKGDKRLFPLLLFGILGLTSVVGLILLKNKSKD